MLSDSKQLYSAANVVYACVEIVYNKVGRFSSFNGSSITSSFDCISRIKKKLTAKLKALERASES